jgi:hypothetical protein
MVTLWGYEIDIVCSALEMAAEQENDLAAEATFPSVSMAHRLLAEQYAELRHKLDQRSTIKPRALPVTVVSDDGPA